jgi:hypothetical protein
MAGDKLASILEERAMIRKARLEEMEQAKRRRRTELPTSRV